MPFDAFIFDFDGTLVDSAPAKYEAFFAVFPGTARHREVVEQVLAKDPDGSRYTVIPRMLERFRELQLTLSEGSVAGAYIEAYGHAVLEAVTRCPEIPGATRILQAVHKLGRPAFISSNTPFDPLRVSVERRGWLPLTNGIYGYPSRKADTARLILEETAVPPARLAVIGDGISDADSAKAVGATFFRISQPADLLAHARSWGLNHV